MSNEQINAAQMRWLADQMTPDYVRESDMYELVNAAALALRSAADQLDQQAARVAELEKALKEIISLRDEEMDPSGDMVDIAREAMAGRVGGA